jgi:hypothetical protein
VTLPKLSDIGTIEAPVVTAPSATGEDSEGLVTGWVVLIVVACLAVVLVAGYLVYRFFFMAPEQPPPKDLTHTGVEQIELELDDQPAKQGDKIDERSADELFENRDSGTVFKGCC